MSDVIYNISSGFYDSVNGDRLYSAADMNKPYKRVIADGIFPTPQGTPSTDFQVVAVSGMSVAVLAGNAMIGARWAENTDDVGITIAGNSSSSPRIDSIFLHIDTGMDTRAAGVVYRQGTAASTPTAPAMVQTDNITELRLADILVAPSAAIITQANITDQRGGSDCPWVAGLIQQVDTSALFDQYRAAYAEQQQEQTDEWKTFMDHLARDYDISMSLRKHESTYTSTAAASLIPINIDGYDTTKDLLQVYINGIFAVEGTHYIVKSAAQIQLTNAISAGQNVHFVIYKAVMGGAQPIIPTDEQVQDAVDAYMDAHPGALVVDPELSDTSTHAIQNKAVAEALAGVNGRLQWYPLAVNVTDGSYVVGSTGGIGTNVNLGYSEISMLPFRGKGIVIQSYLWQGAGYAFLDADGHYITGESANTKGISPATGELTKVETSVPYNAYSLRVSLHKSYANHSSDYYFRITENKATKYVFIGDSYGTGYNASGSTTGWIDGVASSLGLKAADYDKKAKGGAGFRHPANSAPNETFCELLNLSTLAKNDVGHIVVCGGYNDKIYSESQLLTAFETFAAKAREKFPFAEICIGMIGHTTHETEQATVMSTTRLAYMSMCKKDGVRYLSNVEYALFDSDISSADGVHPDQIGADHLILAIGQALKSGSASIEAEQAASRIYDFLPTDTASGAVASFADGADNVPLKSLVVGINPVQSGNGDPSPDNVRPITGWTGTNITTCGKNVLKNTARAHTLNSVTYDVNADGTITANGTAIGGNGRCDVININNPSKALLDMFSGKKLAGCPEGGAYNTYLVQLVINGAVICRDYGNGVQIPDLSQYYGASNLYVDASVRTNYTAENLVFKPMISDDAAYGAYEPYSGESLAVAFPTEAGTVYGGSLDVVSGVLTVTKGFIQSYNGETLPSAWISDRDVYADGVTPTTGAEVCYTLVEPVAYQLSAHEVKSLLGSNTIYADTGVTSVEYRADIKVYINRKIAEAIAALS